MTKRTKRALVSSALALLLCFTMLLGTTYAWFTDSVTTVNNKIVAGNLDIELYSAKQPDANADLAWTMVDANTNIFETGTLWEPGHVEVAYLWAKNVGTLALEWDLAINIVKEVTSTSVLGNDLVLSSYLKAQLVEIDATAPEAYADRDAAKAAVTAGYGLTSYTGNGVLKAGETKAYALIVYMPEEVGNEANYAKGAAVPSIDMGITLLATQTPYENDSFGDDYDEGATYPVASNAQLTEALTQAQDGDTIVFTEGTFELPATIDKALNFVGAPEGTTISATMPTGGTLDNHTAAIKVTANNVTMENLVFDASNGAQGAMVYSQAENLTVENCTFDMRGTNNAGITLWNSDSATIRNCTFINGMKSIYVNGKDTDTDTDIDTLLIEDCTFEGVYALHVGGAVNIVANNCDFNGTAITLWNGTAVFTECDFNDGNYNQLLNYYSPVTFENCFFGGDFVYALRQAKNEVNVTVNGATYETAGNSFADQCGWSIVTAGSLTSYNVVEDGVTTAIPTSQTV